MSNEKLLDEVQQLLDQIDRNIYEMAKRMNAIKEAEGDSRFPCGFKLQTTAVQDNLNS